jgi:predicted membrane channel-forming protein YqfA (hemolysin III family)
MKNTITEKLRINRFLSIIVLILGSLLITYMIIIENELGAIPLFMLTIGIIWFVINEIRIKKYIQKT